MSKKSKKEPFASKLDDLFDEIDERESPDGLTASEGTSGWVWECDGEKKYIKVSAEAELITGISPQDFLGHHLVDFKIADQFVPDMLKVFEAESYPTQAQIAFADASGTYQLVNIHIFANEGKEGWHGFTEALGIPYTPPQESKPAPRAPAVQTPGSQNLAQLEQSMRREASISQAQVQISGNKNVLSANLALSTESAGMLQIIDENSEREWTEDERILVSQVADQLGLALENANLFQQTQSALAETDTLYQASAELNAANDYDEVVDILRKFTIMGQGSSLISVNVFDHSWAETQPEWFHVLYTWSSLDTSRWGNRTRLNARPSIPELLRRDQTVFIDDLSMDSRLGDTARKYFSERFNAQSALFIPLISAGQWIGFVDTFFMDAVQFDETLQRQLASITSQAMEKIASLRLNKLTVSRRRNADNLNKISQDMGEILSMDKAREYLLAQVFEGLNPDAATLYEWQDDRQIFMARDTKSKNLLENLSEMSAIVTPQSRSDIFAIFQNPELKYELSETDAGELHEQLMLPWFIGDQATGVIEVLNTGQSAIIDNLSLEFVEGLTLQAGGAMERARLFEQSQAALALTDEQARRLAVLNDLSSALSQALNQKGIYQLTIDRTHEIFPTERISMTMLDPSRKHVDVVATFDNEGDDGQLAIGQKIPIEGTANEIAVRENRVIMESSDSSSSVPSYMVGPLNIGGEVLGTLNVGSSTAFFFTEQDVNFMNQLLAVVSSSLENRQLFKAIQESLSTSEEQARRLAELNAMTEALGQINDLEGVLDVASQYMSRIIPSDLNLATIFDDTLDLALVYQLDSETGMVKTDNTFEITSTYAHLVGEKGDVQVINDFKPHQASTYPDIGFVYQQGIRSVIIAPLFVAGKAIGSINVCSESSDFFTERERTLMQSISALLGATIDNRQLLTQIQRRSVQMEASAEVSRVASTILDTTELLPRVVELIREGFGLYYCGLFLVDEDGEWTGEPDKWSVLQAGTGKAGEAMLNIGHKLEIGGNSMIGSAISTKEARISLDVGIEEVFSKNPYLPDTRSEMALPLVSRGIALGALTIQSADEAAFSQEDITALQTLADQVANTIENARLFEQTESRAEELTVLNEMARAFTQTLDVDTVVNSTFEYTNRLMEANNFYLALFDEETNMIEFKIFIEENQTITPPEPVLKLGTGLTDWIINNKVPMLIPKDIEGRLTEMGIPVRGRTAASWLGVPMLRGSDVLGVIAVQSYATPNAYGPHEQDLMSAVANQASIAIENARLFQETQGRARREQLLREIAARVHSSADPDIILRTAVREVSNALGRKAFIKLGQSSTSEENGQASIESSKVLPGTGELQNLTDTDKKE